MERILYANFERVNQDVKDMILEIQMEYKKATSKKEAVVEFRITYERKQKYMTTGIFLLPKHWHHGTIVNRVDAIQLNQILEKMLVDVRKVIHVPISGFTGAHPLCEF